VLFLKGNFDTKAMPSHKIDPTKWVDDYSDYLFNYTIARVNDRDMAQDLISDRKSNSKKGKAEVHINYKDEESEGDWLEERVADPFDKTAEDSLQNEELGEAIYRCLGKLPEKQAKIFRMKTIENIDTEVICNEFGITPSNFWVIIHRARTAMAGCMEKNWF